MLKFFNIFLAFVKIFIIIRIYLYNRKEKMTTTIKELRVEKGVSQQELADLL
jgi:hypothetical protein